MFCLLVGCCCCWICHGEARLRRAIIIKTILVYYYTAAEAVALRAGDPPDGSHAAVQIVESARFAEIVQVLFDQASLAGGMDLKDPSAYVERMNRLLLDLLK